MTKFKQDAILTLCVGLSGGFILGVLLINIWLTQQHNHRAAIIRSLQSEVYSATHLFKPVRPATPAGVDCYGCVNNR